MMDPGELRGRGRLDGDLHARRFADERRQQRAPAVRRRSRRGLRGRICGSVRIGPAGRGSRTHISWLWAPPRRRHLFIPDARDVR